MVSSSAADAELLRLAVATAASTPSEVPVGESVAQQVSHAGDGPGDDLVRIVVGARELRRRLAAIEVEAGIQARAAGVTARRLSDATGISERNVRQRFRSPAGERERA